VQEHSSKSRNPFARLAFGWALEAAKAQPEPEPINYVADLQRSDIAIRIAYDLSRADDFRYGIPERVFAEHSLAVKARYRQHGEMAVRMLDAEYLIQMREEAVKRTIVNLKDGTLLEDVMREAISVYQALLASADGAIR
jgi:hypothetical protein